MNVSDSLKSHPDVYSSHDRQADRNAAEEKLTTNKCAFGIWHHLNINACIITELFFWRGVGGGVWYSDTTGVLQSEAISPGLMTMGQRKSDKQPPRSNPLHSTIVN